MGKTPAQQNRAAAKKAGMSHDDVKKQEKNDAHKLKQLANRDTEFGERKSAHQMSKKEREKQRVREENDPTTEAGRKKIREEKKKQQEELAFLLHSKGISVKQPTVPEGDDPKNYLCEFFKNNCCTKNANTCKFSHDWSIAKKVQDRKEEEKERERAALYEDAMENWDIDKLNEVVDKKHGNESNHNLPTTIVCKHFLEAVEQKLYGWFWSCPSGPTCQYRHKLPQGYVLKSELKAILAEERANKKTDNDLLAEKLEALSLEGASKTMVTEDVFMEWKKKQAEKRAANDKKKAEERKAKNALTGRELMELGICGNEGDDGGSDVWDLYSMMRERAEKEEAEAKQIAEAAAKEYAKVKEMMDNGQMCPEFMNEEWSIEARREEEEAHVKGGGEDANEAGISTNVIVLDDGTAIDQSDLPLNRRKTKAQLEEAQIEEKKRKIEEEKEEKARRAEERKAAAAAKRAEKAKGKEKGEKKGKAVDKPDKSKNEKKSALTEDDINPMRAVTGVLSSRPTARDLKIDNFSMSLAGAELVKDCTIELTIGNRYGLLGQNGCGKTNFLQCLALREVPIPEHMDLYHLSTEVDPSNRSGLESVIDWIKEELARLEKMEEEILSTSGPEDERLESIYARLEEIDPTTFESRAAELLHGLGFSHTMMHRHTKDMSGGWRMRVALARALFVAPTLLLLDEPTNHLDLEACVWLEEYLSHYKNCLLLISHSQDFLNGVCTHIIWLTQQKLHYYTGNYDTYCKTVRDNEVVQMKKYEKEQEDIKHLKQFISSCGTYSNLVKQAKSKQKILDKMEAEGLTKPVTRESTFTFRFPDTDKLPPPVLPFIDVSFAYSGLEKDMLYKNIEFGVDCDSRIALVGPNGAGKSTLLKLMVGDLTPTSGTVSRHTHLLIGRFYQHSVDQLDNSLNVLEFMMKTYPNDVKFKRDLDEWRAYMGRFGISGRLQLQKIGCLSEGQKSRIVFAMICMSRPNLLLLDEPTNHLDIEAIDSLAEAINHYNGGLVLVSHDFRLIDQVAKEIWVCEKQTVHVWKQDIRAYKKKLAKGMGISI